MHGRVPILIAWVFALSSLCGAAVRAEIVTIPIPKPTVATALEEALGPTRVHLDNHGARDGTSWLDQDSFVEMPDGSRKSFPLDEETFNVTRFRRIRYYVEDLDSSGVEARAVDDRIEVTLHFESAGEEIKAHCIRRRWGKWKECSLDIERDIHLNDTEITLSLEPVAFEGSISYADPDVTFDTNVRIANRLCQVFHGICNAIEDEVDGRITSEVTESVDQAIRKTSARRAVATAVRNALSSFLDPSWRVIDVESAGGNYLVTVERPDQVDQDSVTALVLAPATQQVVRACPASVDFDATIETRDAVRGTGFLRFEDGTKSPPFNWSAGTDRTITSTIARRLDRSPGSSHQGWGEIVLEWRGTGGELHTRTSNRAEFSLFCTSPVGGSAGGLTFSLFGSSSLEAGGGVDSRRGFGLRASRDIGPNLALELALAGDDLDSETGDADGETYTIDLHPVFWFAITDDLRGSVSAGVGWRFADIDGGFGEDDSFAPAASIGLSWELARGWSLDTRVVQRWLEAREVDRWDTDLQIAISVPIGE